MGAFRITIDGMGGHGVDRERHNGETVDFLAGGVNTPDAIARQFVQALIDSGATISGATIHHWPGQPSQVLDDLISGKRLGDF